MRIKSVEIKNYKAFLGTYKINVAGKNFFIYGENGSGKSSLYYAIKDFFQPSMESINLDAVENIFVQTADHGKCSIKVKFDSDPTDRRRVKPFVFSGTKNERKEQDVLVSEVLEDFTDEIFDLIGALRKEKESFADLVGIDLEEKAFYDILKALTHKYDFEYPEDKLLHLAKEVKTVVDDKARYIDWSQRDDIKAELKADLIILLAENGYPPVDRDEVYKEIFEQAENFKKFQSAGV